MPSASTTIQLLDLLCVKLGFCLPPDERRRLCTCPPSSVESFTDAVFRAEGMDPDVADRHLHRQVRDFVRSAFEDEQASHP